jgi:hypothetical protein
MRAVYVQGQHDVLRAFYHQELCSSSCPVVSERILDISEEYIVHIFSIKLIILDETLLHVGVELGLSHLGRNKG